MTGIYEIRNLVTGQRYVGSSNAIQKRFVTHRSLLRRRKHPNIYLQRAWDKYGYDRFVFRVLAILEPSEQLFIEQRFLMHMRSMKHVYYNIARDASAPMLGLTPSEETIALLRSIRGTPEWKAAQSARIKTYFTNPAARARTSAATQAAMDRPDVRQKHLTALHAAREADPEWRSKIAATLKGHTLTQEHKRKIVEGNKKSWQREDVRANHKAGIAACGPRWNAKLTRADAAAIRAAYPAQSSIALAAAYGVSKKSILNVLHGKTFR